MSSNMKMNPGWERNTENIAKDAIKKSGQPMLDRLSRECKGKPRDEVKRRLSSEWKRVLGGDITDPHLTKYATMLSEGQRIVLT